MHFPDGLRLFSPPDLPFSYKTVLKQYCGSTVSVLFFMTVPDACPGCGIEYESTPPLIPLYKGVRGQVKKEKERYLQDLHMLLKRYFQDLQKKAVPESRHGLTP